MNKESFDIILSVLIVSGGLFSVIISFAQLLPRNRKKINYISFFLYFLYGICVICDTRYRMGTEYLTPHLLYLNYPLLLLLGPVLFFFFRFLVSDDVKIKSWFLLLFVPGVLVFFFFLPFYIQPAEIKLMLFPLSSSDNAFVRTVYNIIDYSLLGWIVFCFLLSLKYTNYVWNRDSLKKIKFIRIILIYIIFWTVLGVFLAYSDITDSFFIYKISLFLSNLFIIFSFFMSYKYPQFFNILRRETSKAKYKRSKLKGLDINAIKERIEELLKYEQIYSDPEITLNILSDILEITPHQLSEIINTHYDTNFNTFINNYRIEAAKEMLTEDSGYNILNIAFNCGFNSKSAFNTVFSRSTGMSPSKFKKKGSEL